MTTTGVGLAAARAALQRHGLLLESDAALPSVATAVAGEPVRGSWWSHPASRSIYDVVGRLMDDPDVVVAKLVSGKVTLVHRRLWPALLALARCGDPWQTAGLSDDARRLFAAVRDAGALRADRLPASLRLSTKSAGEAARDLDRRCLARTWSEHTESGAHAMAIETWDAWARRGRFSDAPPSPAQARAAFEAVLDAWAKQTGVRGSLPWESRPAGTPPRAARANPRKRTSSS